MVFNFTNNFNHIFTAYCRCLSTLISEMGKYNGLFLFALTGGMMVLLGFIYREAGVSP